MAGNRLGDRIQELRKAKGLTQEALAAKSGLHRVYLAQLESGRNQNPQLDTLQRLAKALGVSLGELLD